MDEADRLRRYADASSRSLPLRIDVRADVLATLRSGRTASFSASPFLAVAATGWLVAASVGFFAVHAMLELQDPVVSLVTPLVVSLP